MQTSRSGTPHSAGLKYNYRGSASQARQNGLHQDLTAKKDSRMKLKREGKTALPKQWRDPLSELKTENIEKCLDLADYHKRQSSELRKKNGMLQERIRSQEGQIERLRLDVENLKKTARDTVLPSANEDQGLLRTNYVLEQKFRSQKEEIQFLKQAVSHFREQQPMIGEKEDDTISLMDIGDAYEISRRKEYMKQYQSIIEELRKGVCCQKCRQKEETNEAMKEKYGNQLRALQAQITVLKEKELLLQVLEKQLTSKNDCIDFLRGELQSVERSSGQLLCVIDHLQRKFQVLSERVPVRQVWRRPSSSLSGAYDYRY